MSKSKSKSLERYKTRKLLEELAEKKGYGTELISLYIPQGKQISDVSNYLKQEYGTATNIKSKTTQKNVQSAIVTIQQKLKIIPQSLIDEYSIVIFAGAIPQNGGPGTERMEIYPIVPPEPINIYMYRCASEFVLDPLRETLLEKDSYGLIAMDRSEAIIGELRGSHLEIHHRLTSGVHGKHRAGGQSQRRYERVIEQQVHEFFVRVGEYASQIYLGIPDFKGLFVGGPGPTKEDFVNKDYLDYRVKEKLLGTSDLSYSGEQGLKELISKIEPKISDVRYVEEKKLVQRFLRHLAKETGRAIYGEKEVREYLEQGAVAILLLSEALDIIRVTISCESCGHIREKTIHEKELAALNDSLASEECPQCSSSLFSVSETKKLIEDLAEIAENVGARVEVISAETEEGAELWNAFKGIAGILRYTPS
ncbi:peptide chain release factor aRF-1 [Candidatus Borrarchaeum sp.]|uniref:peptide chain release factor aRF-1 n=1 Tax=Candidatus Borrarchaeum sp. TaxID=2846742 RepID=UPI00257F6AA6|nr:peptide chain release factor aRF-1 [Candidatus Borrarchaeum sp.]